MDMQLTGKRAIVTGASRGIGRAIAQALAQEGANVALCARGQAGVDDAVAAVRACGSEAYGEALDVRAPQALDGFVQRAAGRWGGIDIVVSNVSTRPDAQGLERWRQAFEVDLLQHVHLAELTAPLLVAGKGGSLLFVASIASVMTQLMPDEVAYGALKAGVVNYAGALAERLGASGVRVNTLSPGPVDFEGGFWDQVRQHKPKLYDKAMKLAALGRFAQPEEVARAATFLSSPAASFITGANLRVDGGCVKSTNF